MVKTIELTNLNDGALIKKLNTNVSLPLTMEDCKMIRNFYKHQCVLTDIYNFIEH